MVCEDIDIEKTANDVVEGNFLLLKECYYIKNLDTVEDFRLVH